MFSSSGNVGWILLERHRYASDSLLPRVLAQRCIEADLIFSCIVRLSANRTLYQRTHDSLDTVPSRNVHTPLRLWIALVP